MNKAVLYVIIFLLSNYSYAQKSIKEIDQIIQKAVKYGDRNQQGAISLAQEAYHSSKKIGYNKGMVKSLIIIAHNNYNLGKYEEVFKYATEAEKLAYIENTPETIAEVMQLKGQGYFELGFLKQSKETYKKGISYTAKIKNKDDLNYRQGFLNSALALTVEKEGLAKDSIIYYLQKSLANYENLSSGYRYRGIVISMTYSNMGVYYFKQNQNKSAVNNIKKAISLNNNSAGSEHIKARNLYLLGEIYSKEKKNDSSLIYYRQGLEIAKKLKNPYRLEEIYKGLSELYSSTKTIDSAQLYLQKYVTIKDSLSTVEKSSVKTPLKNILDQKDLEFNESKKNIYILAGIALFSVLVICSALMYDSRKSRRNYKRLIHKLETEKSETPKIPFDALSQKDILPEEIPFKKQPSGILQETEKEIIDKLNDFEKGNDYINPDLSMPMLAGMLNTNPRYLSEIINKTKGKNYNQYINQLRINFIVDTLYKDKIFLEYKISYLADYCGFSSREVFASVFKKETGVSPSYFINHLKKENQSGQA